MKLNALTTKEIALILTGLRAVHVADEAALQEKMIRDCEEILASRGVRLAA